MLIKLINAPNRDCRVLGDTWYLPLGLIQIATYLENNGIVTKIIDGVGLGLDQTLSTCAADVVGIAFNSFNSWEMEAIVKKAKNQGAFTVLGGHAASATADYILEQNQDIDAVVVGDGELAMLELVKALSRRESFSRVPNLVYRSCGEIVHNRRLELPISGLPFPRRDAGGLNPDSYIRNYATSCSDAVEFNLRPTNLVTRRGCPRRAGGQGCSFCARIDRKVRTRIPFQAWEEYRYLVEELDVNYLYEDSDSWIDVGWLRELANIWEKNGGLDVRFRVYGDVRDISPHSVSLLKRLNVDTVLLGIESGDRNVLLQNGKDFTCAEICRACSLLAETGIKVADAYVLGLAGETWSSIEKTVRLSESVHLICETSATYWNIMLPLPGSPSWEMLSRVSPQTTDMTTGYRLDMNIVRQDFFSHCTELGSHALERLEKLRAELCRQSSMLVGEYIR